MPLTWVGWPCHHGGMRTYLVVLMLLGACGAPSDADDVVGDDGPDADVTAADGGPDGGEPPDSDPGTPDAASSTGRPLGASCDVFLDECADGGTCRLIDAQGHGQCRVVGDQPAGSDCSVPSPFYAIQPCGEAMICNGTQPDMICQVLCDPADPDARCSSGEDCGEIVDGVGVCY